MQLADKVALVVGGASGIGLAIAQRFGAEGAEVYVTGRRQPELDAAVARIGRRAYGIRADASRPDDLKAIAAALSETPGRVDALVVSAALSESCRIDEVTEEHFDRHIGLNVRALLFGVQSVLPLMGPGSAIVLIGSVAAGIGTEGFGVYGASKAAVRALARTLTTELAPRGVRVNVVSPGPTDTAMFSSVPEDARLEIAGRIPLGRLARPAEVAAAVLFLASDESSFIAGVDLAVDGGWTQT